MRPKYTITIYKDSKGKFRWRARHANGEKIANGGESYTRRIDLTTSLANFIEGLIDTHYKIVDTTQKEKKKAA